MTEKVTLKEKDAPDSVMVLIRRQLDLRDKVSTLEEELKNAKAELRAVQFNDLPELIQSEGIESVELLDGSLVFLMREVHCSVTKDNFEEFRAWAKVNHVTDLLKFELSVPFKKGKKEKELFEACVKALTGVVAPLRIETSGTVHPATLKAFVKARLDSGEELPNCIGLYAPFVAYIEPPETAE